MTRTAPATGLLDDIFVVDADTHLTEPHDLWTSRAPKQWVDRVPQVRDVKGRDMWTIDGEVFGLAVGASVVLPDGAKSLGTGFMQLGIDEVHAGASSIEPAPRGDGRARHLRADRVPERGRLRRPPVRGHRRPELKVLCATIFNDAMAEFQDVIRAAHVPHGAAAVVGHRCRGRRGVTGARARVAGREHQQRSAERGLAPTSAERHWDPLWEVCADLAMPVNFHIGASATSMSWLGSMPWPSLDPERKLALGSLMIMISNFRTMGNLLLSGVLERHPELHVVSVESGLGWIPFLIEGLDYEVGECAPHIGEHLSHEAVGVLPPPDARLLLVRGRQLQGCTRRARSRQHDVRDRLPAPDVPVPRSAWRTPAAQLADVDAARGASSSAPTPPTSTGSRSPPDDAQTCRVGR